MPPGILHIYHPSRNLTLFEHHSSNVCPPTSILLFIGGMFDNFLSPHYTTDLAALFPPSPTQSWRLIHIQLSSAGRSFGIFSIDRDIEEISQAITFLHNLYNSPNIILMGHSTGCQDIMRYITAPNPLGRTAQRPQIQGAILQAPVSDRDAMLHSLQDEPPRKAYEQIIKIISETSQQQYRDVILPMNLTKQLFGPVPMSVSRFLSLASPSSPEKPSDEDFFSKDLTDQRLRSTFGEIGRRGILVAGSGRRTSTTSLDSFEGGEPRLLVLMSDSDEFAGGIDQKQLLGRWKTAMMGSGAEIHGDSAVILNALHDIGGEDWPSQEARLVVMRRKVLQYLKDCVGVVEGANEVWMRDGDRVMALKAGDGRRVEDMVGVLKL